MQTPIGPIINIENLLFTLAAMVAGLFLIAVMMVLLIFIRHCHRVLQGKESFGP